MKEEKIKLEEISDMLASAEEAQKIVQEIAQSVQEVAHDRIASVVSRCLETVFGEDCYEFKILFERKRGRTEARLLFVRDGQEYDPTGESGGGVVDVAATALRLACLLLSQPRKRKLLILDEPWKHLSSEYRPAVRDLILALSKEMGVQFVIVTHDSTFHIGKVIELEK